MTLATVPTLADWQSGDPTPAADEAGALLEPIDLLDWAERDPPPRRWVAPGLIPLGAVTSLYGLGGAGKSILALGLMVALAGNKPWLGRDLGNVGAALGIFAEDDRDELIRRVKRVAREVDVSLADRRIAGMIQLVAVGEHDPVLMVFEGGGAEPTFTSTWFRLEELVKDHYVGLLVLDYAAAVFGGDEVRRDQVVAFMAALNRLAARHQMAVLLLGHPSADGMRNGRGHSGSTAWFNQARSFLHLEAKEGDVEAEDGRSRLTLTVRKANYARAGDVLSLAFDGTSFELLEESHGARKKGRPHRLTPPQEICLRAFHRAADESSVPSPGGPIPATARCVTVDMWRTYALHMGVTDSSDDASRRQAWKRTHEALVAKGLVTIAGTLAWGA